MKQSSIEWLMEIDKSRAITIEEWEQAKAMHKEEIENAYWDGGQWVPTSGSQCEEYYNETFNTILVNPTKWSETFNTKEK